MSQFPINSSELISRFKASKLPSGKFPKEFLIHQDVVFHTEARFPEVNLSHDFSHAFITETKKFNNYNNHPNPSNNFHKSKNAPKIDEESNDFFDNFKGKFNPKDVSTFKRNAEMHSRNVLSIQYTKRKFVDLFLNPKVNGDIVSIDEFFGVDEEDIEGSKLQGNKIHQDLQIKEDSTFIKSNTFLALEISECIYLVNERLGYPKDKPLWYIYHESAESSYGPLSSSTILEMLSIKLLTIESKIRFIDVFVYRGSLQFNFFNIKDIKRSNFHDNIRVSEFAKLAPISVSTEAGVKDKAEGIQKSSIIPPKASTQTKNSNSQSSSEADFFDNRKVKFYICSNGSKQQSIKLRRKG